MGAGEGSRCREQGWEQEDREQEYRGSRRERGFHVVVGAVVRVVPGVCIVYACAKCTTTRCMLAHLSADKFTACNSSY